MGYLLPVGTIVKAKLSQEHSIRVMIVGHYPRNKKNQHIYDYATIFYPMGVTMRISLQGLNHSAIQEVEAMGCEDEDTKTYLDGLETVVDAMNQVAMKYQKNLEEEEQKDISENEGKDSLDEGLV